MSGTDRALRRRELVREEARLKELEAQCDRLRLRIGELRNEVRARSEPFRSVEQSRAAAGESPVRAKLRAMGRLP